LLDVPVREGDPNDGEIQQQHRRNTMRKGLFIFLLSIVSAVGGASAAAPKNLVETAKGDPRFSTLVELVQTAGLAETLSGSGPFTLFAPTNEAFAKVPAETLKSLKQDKEKLASVLKYHVVSGKVPASQVVNLSDAKSVEGSSIRISKENGNVKVDNATVTKTDIMTSNGIIHVIDTVIMPNA